MTADSETSVPPLRNCNIENASGAAFPRFAEIVANPVVNGTAASRLINVSTEPLGIEKGRDVAWPASKDGAIRRIKAAPTWNRLLTIVALLMLFLR
jgi:hypothetical protein